MSEPWKPGPIATSLSASPDLSNLHAFTAPVLLPAKDLQPFEALPLAIGADGITAAQATYTIYFGTTDGWRIAGLEGRDSYNAIGGSPGGGVSDCAPNAPTAQLGKRSFSAGSR